MATGDVRVSSNPGGVMDARLHASQHREGGVMSQDAMDCKPHGQHSGQHQLPQLPQQQQQLSPRTMQHNALSFSLPGLVQSHSARPLKLYNSIIPTALPPADEKPGREDCWSEGATFTLIEAWGDRYVELNRGNLKQKHWKDVAGAVNGREDLKNPKTDVQCKNRLDTLKKKYKLEKTKVAASGRSKWIYYDKLDELIGTSRKELRRVAEPVQKAGRCDDDKEDAGNVEPKTFNHANTNTKSKESPVMTDSCPHAESSDTEVKTLKKRKSQDSPFKDLAKAIIKLGEVYERIESAKQQQLMDLEKQRMQFMKDLELQRMQLFMQTQVELAKMKHEKHGSTGIEVF